jgi:hypothetical protein
VAEAAYAERRFEAASKHWSATPKVARFRQIQMEEPNAHHDALEFPDGQIVLLTRLYEGQHATVLQLPAPDENVAMWDRYVKRPEMADAFGWRVTNW